jgi:hypothetical protein
MTAPRWLIAALLFSTGLPGVDAFNISLIPIRAHDDEDAETRAARFGAELAQEYTAGRADDGAWVYERTLFIHEMIENELREGVELYTFFASEDVVRDIDQKKLL